MKLIDLLVQELPKLGGWPDDTTALVQYSSGYVYQAGGEVSFFHFKRAEDWELAEITREQYEAAIAAAQQPAWDGDGLPPVGCECEGRFILGGEWFVFRCVAVDCGIAFGWAGKDAVTLDKGSYEFRPIPSEADKKRAEGVTALAKAAGNDHFEYGRMSIDGELSSPGWYELYDKIAAGEVAGIRIE